MVTRLAGSARWRPGLRQTASAVVAAPCSPPCHAMLAVGTALPGTGARADDGHRDLGPGLRQRNHPRQQPPSNGGVTVINSPAGTLDLARLGHPADPRRATPRWRSATPRSIRPSPAARSSTTALSLSCRPTAPTIRSARRSPAAARCSRIRMARSPSPTTVPTPIRAARIFPPMWCWATARRTPAPLGSGTVTGDGTLIFNEPRAVTFANTIYGDSSDVIGVTVSGPGYGHVHRQRQQQLYGWHDHQPRQHVGPG